MNDLSECREPLRLSDEELRIELSQNRSGSCKCEENCYVLFIAKISNNIRNLEMLIKSDQDQEFLTSLFDKRISFYTITGELSILINMGTNLVLCALFGRKPYQDFDGTWHIPLFCFNQSYSTFSLCRWQFEYQLEWFEASSVPSGDSLHLRDWPVINLTGGIWETIQDYLPQRYFMFLIRFGESSLLERVILHADDWQEMFQEDQIMSIDFMEFKIYGIVLDSQIKDWRHLTQEIEYHDNHPKTILQPPGCILPKRIQIGLETHPQLIPVEIRQISFYRDIV